MTPKGRNDMGKIKIELFEFSLMINHPDGLTVIFPEANHVLAIEQDGTTTPVNHGADLELRGPGGVKLPAGKPKEVDYKKFVVDIEQAEATKIAVPASLLDAKTPVDRTCINGRLFLTGGTIIGKECSIPANRTPFNFKGGKFLVTDSATFELDIADTEVAELWVNGNRAIEIEDGKSIRIRNSDGLGCPLKGFQRLDEFVDMCKTVGLNNATPPKVGGSPITAMGGQHVCAHAQMTTP
jgi:hypothetical protein